MARRLGYSFAVGLTAIVAVAAVGAHASRNATEAPLAALVGTSADAATAVLPDGAWAVELAALLPGDVDVSVAPDGRRVAFASARDGNHEIYVADEAAGTLRRLTVNRRSPDRRPAWSPRGDLIAWRSGTEGQADLYVMRADGRGKRLLAGGAGDDDEPAWSPDGARVAFTSTRSGRRQLWSVAVEGGEPEPLADVPGRTRAPSWSPDGSLLAFARETGGDSNIWRLDLADGTTRALTRGPGWDSRPDWSPAGGRLAFARAARGQSSLWIVGADGAAAAPVRGAEGLADPDWARTDRSLVPRPDELLPDLDQRAPAELVVVQTGRTFRLGFASSTENHGIGPLVIRGVRIVGPSMRAHQVVELRSGATRSVDDVGLLNFEPHAPHRHWHLESFVRYELRGENDDAPLVRDRKSGFCLIDRWGQVLPRVPGSGPPRFVGDCEAGRPEARSVLQGTSVGYIDRYPAFFHGQELDLTGLRPGRYVLVHRANPLRTMREVRYSNDNASVLLELTWPDGRSSAPRVAVLRRCEETDRCELGA